MTLEEIYADIAAHMIKGLMIHEQLANYYDFLGLEGYKRCHEYHYIEESVEYRGLCRYYINHHNRLILDKEIEAPDIIPESWYDHVRQDVDTSTKKNAVKTGLASWVDWETKTKKFYEKMWKELIDIDEVASACKIKELIHDVDKELKKATRYLLNKEAIGYDIGAIIAEQGKMHNKYKKKIERKYSVHL